MINKSISEESQFDREKKNNERIFKEMLKDFRPDVFALMDILDETSINWFVVVKIIRQLANLSLGTGYGVVSVEIQNGKVLFINGEDRDRLNEPLIEKKN